MAFRAYDLVLTVRAQNQTTSALRQISSDLRKMGGSTRMLNAQNKIKNRLDEIAAAKQGASTKTLRRLNREEALLRDRLIEVNAAMRAAPWERLSRAGAIVRDLGRTARLTGLVMGAGIGLAAAAYARFNEEASLTATQMGEVGRSFQAVQKDARVMENTILDVMKNSTSSTQELNQASYDLFSSLSSSGKAFLTVADGQKLLKLTSDAAIAGMTDVGVATNGVISVMNAFGIPAEKMNQVMQRLFAGVRFGRMTFEEFSNTLAVTSPAAKAANQSLDTLVGTMAFLTRRLDVRKAAIGFARLTEILSRAKFVKGLKDAGVQITNTQGQLLQLPEVISRITKAFPALTRGGILLTNFFKKMSGTEGTIQARRAFVFLAQQLDEYKAILGATTRDNNEFTKSLSAQSQTLGVRWKKFQNSVRSAMLSFGRDAIPAIMAATKPLQDLFKSFQNLDPEVKRNIATWGVWAAAIAVAGGTLAALVGGFASLIGILGRMRLLLPGSIILFTALATNVTGLNKALGSSADILHEFGRTLGFAADQFGSLSGQNMLLATVGLTLLTKRFVSTGKIGARTATSLKATFARLATTIGTVGIAASTGLMGRNLQGATRGAGTWKNKLRLVSGEWVKINKSAGISQKLMSATVTSLALLPGPLKLAAGITGALAAGAFLWHRHMEGVRDRAKEIDRALAPIEARLQRIARAAKDFEKVPDAFLNLKQSTASIGSLFLQIADLTKQISQARPAERPFLEQQLQGLQAELANARREARKFETQITRGMNNGRIAIQSFLNAGGQVPQMLTKIAALEQEREALRKKIITGVAAPEDWARFNALPLAIDKLRAKLNLLSKEAGQSGANLSKNREAVKSLLATFGDFGILPPNLPDLIVRQTQAAIGLAKHRLKPAEITTIVKAMIDPKAFAAASAGIQELIKQAEILALKIKYGVEQVILMKTALGITVQTPEILITDPRNATKKVQKQIKAAQKEVQDVQKQINDLLGGADGGGAGKTFKLPISDQLAISNAEISGNKASIIAALKAAEAHILKLRKSAKGQELEDLNQALLDIRGQMDSVTKSTDTATKAVDEFQQKVDTAAGVLKGAMTDALTTNKTAFGDFITGSKFFTTGVGSFLSDIQQQIMEFDPNWKTIFSPKDILDAGQQQLDAFKRWRDDLTTLGKKLPPELADSLAAAGPEATPILEAIMKMSPAQRSKLIKQWKQSRTAIEKATKADFDKRLKYWKSLGKSIFAKIIEGMSPDEAKIDDWATEFGKAILKSLGKQGLTTKQTGAKPKAKPRKPANARTNTRGNENTRRPASVVNYNQTVHANYHESLDTTLRRAHFRFRNRTMGGV